MSAASGVVLTLLAMIAVLRGHHGLARAAGDAIGGFVVTGAASRRTLGG